MWQNPKHGSSARAYGSEFCALVVGICAAVDFHKRMQPGQLLTSFCNFPISKANGQLFRETNLLVRKRDSFTQLHVRSQRIVVLASPEFSRKSKKRLLFAPRLFREFNRCSEIMKQQLLSARFPLGLRNRRWTNLEGGRAQVGWHERAVT